MHPWHITLPDVDADYLSDAACEGLVDASAASSEAAALLLLFVAYSLASSAHRMRRVEPMPLDKLRALTCGCSEV